MSLFPAQKMLKIRFGGVSLSGTENDEFSPYPVEQLAWGFFNDIESGKIFLFATPFSKLKNLGWQNLELFRRVFPSFVSFD